MIIEIKAPASFAKLAWVWGLVKLGWQYYDHPNGLGDKRSWALWTYISKLGMIDQKQAQKFFEEDYPALYDDALKRFHEAKERHNMKINLQTTRKAV